MGYFQGIINSKKNGQLLSCNLIIYKFNMFKRVLRSIYLSKHCFECKQKIIFDNSYNSNIYRLNMKLLIYIKC